MEQVKQMVDLFMEAGLTYFDTAYVYDNGDSERAAKEALVERYPRESFTLATKLCAWMGRIMKRRQSSSSIPVWSAPGPDTLIITCCTLCRRAIIRPMTNIIYGIL